MYKFLRHFLGLLFPLQLIWMPVNNVVADIGPKPSMEFEFDLNDKPISIISGEIIKCGDSQCVVENPTYDNPLYNQDIWFDCDNDTCSSMTVGGYHEFHLLRIEFTDKMRESNVFGKKSYNAHYQVLVVDDKLEVQEVLHRSSFSLLSDLLIFIFSLFVTILIEIFVSKKFFKYIKVSFDRKPIVWANLISLITIYIVFRAFLYFSHLNLSDAMFITISEIFVVIFEAVFIYFAFREKGISFPNSISLSVLINVCSFLIGLVIFAMIL